MPERLHPAIVMMPDASGQYMRFQHFAAGPVRTDTPEKERVPVLVRYNHGTYVLTYYEGSFRHPGNGSTWARPLAWAYLTWEPVEDVEYNDAEGGGYLPESKGLWLYDTMKLVAKFHKLEDVQNIIDRLEWGNPEEGAPEDS